MENQHRKIKGYRELSQEEIDLMNEIKSLGLAFEATVLKVKKHIADQRRTGVTSEEVDRLNAAEPDRWASIGKTDIQTGLMALTRSVAQPTFF